MEITYRFKFPQGPNEEHLRQVFAVPANLSPFEIERRVRHQISRFVPWTGINQPDALSNGKPFYADIGWKILEWIEQNKACNSGIGPTVDCATMANLYVSVLAAYKIAARRIAVLFQGGGPDHVAEFSIEDGRWCMVIPHLNAAFLSARKGTLMSYLDAWMDQPNADFTSPTDGWPMCRSMDSARESYRQVLFTKAAYALNGNAVNIDGTTPVLLSLTPEEYQNGDWIGAPSLEKSRGCSGKQLYPKLGPLSEDMTITIP